jgi:stage V sporulation protein G
MEITEIKIKLCGSGSHEHLLATASIVFQSCFAVRDIRIIHANNKTFVSMPSRKQTERCRECGSKNAFDARFCSSCGARQLVKSEFGHRCHLDTAHPITPQFRMKLEAQILQAYRKELALSQLPGYRPAPDSGMEAAVAAPLVAGAAH